MALLGRTESLYIITGITKAPLIIHVVGTCARTPPRQIYLAPPLVQLEASYRRHHPDREAPLEDKDNLKQSDGQRDRLGSHELRVDEYPPGCQAQNRG